MDMMLDFTLLGPLFDLSKDAYLFVANDRIVYANTAAAKLTGAAAGAPADSVFPEYILKEDADHFATSLTLPDDRKAGLSALRRNGGLLLCLTDIGAPRLLSAGSLQGLSESLATLRLSVDGLISSARRQDDAPARAYGRAAYQSYYRLLRLYRHLSLSENLRDGHCPFQRRLLDLREMAEDLCASVNALTESLDMHVDFRWDPADYSAAGDKVLLEVMLLNLFTNSFQRSHGQVRLHLGRRNGQFLFTVQDDGEGLSPRSLQFLFGGGPTGDLPDAPAGDGLGLDICRGIAELHGGALLIDSRDGASSVRILLPSRTDSDPLLRSPEVPYGNEGLNRILTELSPLLPGEKFQSRYLD